MTHDVAIVGAGAAGIAAARRLAAAGRSVVLLEASDRVGGRAWTLGLAGMALDLGCGWLHSADRNALVAHGERLGFTIDRTGAAWRAQWRDLGFTAAEQAAANDAWEAFMRRLREAPPASDRAADAFAAGEWRGFAEALSGYVNGVGLDRLSATDFLAYDDAASDRNWRVREGYGSLIAASLPAIDLRLSAPVRRIRLTGTGVELETGRGALEASTALVTVSTAVLAAGRIAFGPEADGHLHAAATLPLGAAEKLFLELREGHGLEPETHLIGDPRDAETGSYYIMPFGCPAIECFFGGAGALARGRGGPAAAFAFVQDQLAALLGTDIRHHLRPLAASAWARADWIGGSYSHALPGCAAQRARLAAPLDGRLFFAGEATHPTDFSTAHGAWESGLRAADEILARPR